MAKKTPASSDTASALLLANGDLRLVANQNCWAAQQEMEASLIDAARGMGYTIERGHPYKKEQGHGFIQSQKEGMAVFADIDPTRPVIVAEAVWQYSHHILHGLMFHEGPILTVANWSGTWPGLVGMLNLNGSMTKAGIKYSTLWAEDFAQDTFQKNLRKWFETGSVTHPTKHVTPLQKITLPDHASEMGERLAATLRKGKAIMGIFDEGCMGMFNAIIPDSLLNPTGVFKERLSQSALYYETTQTSDEEARAVRGWMERKGMTFHTGTNDGEHLTDEQILQQCKMYIAAVRIADDYGCDSIGIQYQQGLKDLLPASDLVEGTLNNTQRPPVTARGGEKVLYKGRPLTHFNEVDECAALDGMMTYRVHKELGQPVENTLHDLRWGDWDQSGTTDEYVWVFEISGSAPPAHFIGGWKGAEGFRQPAMYFPLGGATLRGISKPGEIVWSRIWMDAPRPGAPGKLKMDLGRGGVIKLPKEETQRRWELTTWQWPIMHAVTYGTSRDQMMARHKANHIQCVYAKDEASADLAMLTKAAMAGAMGMEVAICGTRKGGEGW